MRFALYIFLAQLGVDFLIKHRLIFLWDVITVNPAPVDADALRSDCLHCAINIRIGAAATSYRKGYWSPMPLILEFLLNSSATRF